MGREKHERKGGRGAARKEEIRGAQCESVRQVCGGGGGRGVQRGHAGERPWVSGRARAGVRGERGWEATLAYACYVRMRLCYGMCIVLDVCLCACARAPQEELRDQERVQMLREAERLKEDELQLAIEKRMQAQVRPCAVRPTCCYGGALGREPLLTHQGLRIGSESF